MLGDVALAEENEQKFKADFELQNGNYKLSHLGRLSPVDFICYRKPELQIHSVNLAELEEGFGPEAFGCRVWMSRVLFREMVRPCNQVHRCTHSR